MRHVSALSGGLAGTSEAARRVEQPRSSSATDRRDEEDDGDHREEGDRAHRSPEAARALGVALMLWLATHEALRIGRLTLAWTGAERAAPTARLARHQ
jgi:hypothetical protein